jgi:hypothetical protein
MFRSCPVENHHSQFQIPPRVLASFEVELESHKRRFSKELQQTFSAARPLHKLLKLLNRMMTPPCRDV